MIPWVGQGRTASEKINFDWKIAEFIKAKKNLTGRRS
jgi:hypothetical protein